MDNCRLERIDSAKESSARKNMELSVLIVFFNRPDTLKKVFESVKQARPQKLFLACDGPRENNVDQDKIKECKQIVENIDWKCDVFKNYSEVNYGCGEWPQKAISWAFSLTDTLVVLEDDAVPFADFYPYMVEMLEKYKNDSRVCYISGFTHQSGWNCGNASYIFAKNGPAAGAWGSWRRVWDDYDFTMKDIFDPHIQNMVISESTSKHVGKRRLRYWMECADKIKNKNKVSFWDIQLSFVKYKYSYLTVVPSKSLASNIGIGLDSTHAKRMFYNPIPSLFFVEESPFEFPIRHPNYLIRDYDYDKMVENKWLFPSMLTIITNHLCNAIMRFKK